MCGILFTQQTSNEKNIIIQEKFDLIKYRGPDNTTLVCKNGLIFGHHRLKILNENSDSNQPIVKTIDGQQYILV